MASNFIVNFIGNNKLSKTTAVITRDLQKMGKTVDKVGSSLTKAFGLAGAGLSIGALTTLLKDSSKAAAADASSQKQLALALQNTVGANKGAIAGAEDFISKLSKQVSIVDDELRPALATATRATGSLAKGQELLNLAVDVSAGTGKDLVLVTKSIARAQSGQVAGLQKLVPGLKAGTNWMEQLKTQFAGAAVAAANTDPYKRISVIMDDLKETIGMALLPYLQKMANYLASERGQKQVKKLVDNFIKIADNAGKLVSFLTENINLIINLAKLALELKAAWMLNVWAMKLYSFWTDKSVGGMKALGMAIKRTGIGLLVVGVAELAAGFTEAQAKGQNFVDWAKDNLEASGTGIIDFSRWLFGQESLTANKERKAKAFQDRWINLGKKFATEAPKKIGDILKTSQQKMDAIGQSFRDSVGLAFGTFGKDENSVFNVDMVIAKLKRMVDAAKGFANNLKQLTKQGAGQDVINELISMGPAQGNIVAKGLLSSGRLSEYLGLRGSLYGTGASAAGVMNTASTANYTINLNKANVSATDIINAIRQYEKKTGRKYFAN